MSIYKCGKPTKAQLDDLIEDTKEVINVLKNDPKHLLDEWGVPTSLRSKMLADMQKELKKKEKMRSKK